MPATKASAAASSSRWPSPRRTSQAAGERTSKANSPFSNRCSTVNNWKRFANSARKRPLHSSKFEVVPLSSNTPALAEDRIYSTIGAEERLRLFLIQRFGGPATYNEQCGHPRLRMRHAPFPVDERARNRWIALM